MNRFDTAPLKLPWHDDYPLTPEDVRSVIAVDLPEFGRAPVDALGDGWDFKTFLVDGAWVFRFPKRRQCARQLKRERTLLEALVTPLSTQSIAIPRYHYFIDKPRRFALPYAGYPLLRGDALLSCSVHLVEPRRVGRQLGLFLGALQAAAPQPAPRSYRDQFPAYLPDFRRELDDVATQLPDHLVAACRGLLDAPLQSDPNPPVYQHADLGAEHILIDPERGDIAAIIDWGDAGWGHTVGDLVGLWAWGGDAAVAAASAAWQQPLSCADWRRLRLRGAAYAMGSAYYGYKDRRDPLFETALGWLERMYANGQLSDPESPDA